MGDGAGDIEIHKGSLASGSENQCRYAGTPRRDTQVVPERDRKRVPRASRKSTRKDRTTIPYWFLFENTKGIPLSFCDRPAKFHHLGHMWDICPIFSLEILIGAFGAYVGTI